MSGPVHTPLGEHVSGLVQLDVVQTHAPPVHAGVVPEHVEQLPPVDPHAVESEDPGAHVPPLQQPPLHGCEEEHAVVHIPVDVSHASSAGQSPATAQPQVPLTRQALPDDRPAQSTHDPLRPQASCSVPGTHVPLLQQPPLHGWDVEQIVVQVPVEVSHASSTEHPADEVQLGPVSASELGPSLGAPSLVPSFEPSAASSVEASLVPSFEPSVASSVETSLVPSEAAPSLFASAPPLASVAASPDALASSHSHGPKLSPLAKQTCPPAHPPTPVQATDAPGMQGVPPDDAPQAETDSEIARAPRANHATARFVGARLIEGAPVAWPLWCIERAAHSYWSRQPT
jgi:hypothetical protein